jgi:hypothetical protein
LLDIMPLGHAGECRGFAGTVRLGDSPGTITERGTVNRNVGDAIRSLAAAAADDPKGPGLFLSLVGAIQAIAEGRQ